MNHTLVASGTRGANSVTLLELWAPGYDTVPVYVVVLVVKDERTQKINSWARTGDANYTRELFDQSMLEHIADELDQVGT